MHIALLTNEYPPHVYGGAGVHVQNLVREMASLLDKDDTLQVLCFGDQDIREGNLTITGVNPPFKAPFQEARHRQFMDAMLRNLVMTGSIEEADVVHCHTWYTHLAGCLLKQLLGAPLVLTTHSLEPHRPWKRDQLGSAYDASTWVEKTAYQNADGVVAVSQAMKRDVKHLYGVPEERVRVIHNGIDPNTYRPTANPDVLARYGIDSDVPFVLFVGRITQQKGITHLVRAIRHMRPGVQVVLCAGRPDTEEIGRQMAREVEAARGKTQNKVIWISEMVPRESIISLYTHASVFVCPSVYEPFGLINLEAMACETPVVASAVGGIPEIVVHGETGLLVPLEPSGPDDAEPKDPARFSRDLASAVNTLLDMPQEKLRAMGIAARQRVEQHFTWTRVAERTLEFYQALLGS